MGLVENGAFVPLVDVERVGMGRNVGTGVAEEVGVVAVVVSTLSLLCFNDKRGEVGIREVRDMSGGTLVSSSRYSPGRLRRHKLRFSSYTKIIYTRK